jgi:glycosyltransferase involved in cell wall biosynthesis
MTASDPSGILIGSYFPRGVQMEGVGSFVRGLAGELVRQGQRVRLLLPQGRYEDLHGVESVFYRPGLLGLSRYWRAIRCHSADVRAVWLIENNPNMVGLVAASACPDSTLMCFCTPLQNFAFFHQAGLSRQALVHGITKHVWLARWMRWQGRRCLVGSEYQARQLRQVGAEDVHVVPLCGVSKRQSPPVRNQARAVLGWDDRPVVGYLGHFSPAKGVRVLLEAFARYDGPAVLALAHSGKGRLASSPARRLEELDRQGRLRRLGVVDPLTFLAACDLVALPYVTSSIFHPPQVLLESFAAGTAVVTTHVGGLDEFVQDNVTGELVAPRNPQAMAGALHRRLGDLNTTHRMGQVARERFENRWCLEVTVEAMLGLTARGAT